MLALIPSRLPRSFDIFSRASNIAQCPSSMTSSTQPLLGRSIASHLEIAIDSNDPPPAATLAFTNLRQQVQDIWQKFETAEKELILLDDRVNEQVLEYVSGHRRATGPELKIERARFTTRLYESPVVEAEACCDELENAIPALEEAAQREPKTLEGRATLELDIEVMRKNLATTRDILHVAHVQLQQARSLLNPA